MLAAVTTAFLLLDQDTFDQFRFWQVGALAGRDLSIAAQVAPFLIIGTSSRSASARCSTPSPSVRTSPAALGANVVLGGCCPPPPWSCSAAPRRRPAGRSASSASPFRTLPACSSGPDYRWALPYSLLLAPILLLAADIIGRVIARPGEVQVAIVTAVIGAPVFIALVRQRKLAEL